jgi:hypothetical protein
MGRKLALYFFLSNFLGNNLWNISLIFWKRFLYYKTIITLVNSYIIITRLIDNRTITNQEITTRSYI